MKEISEIIAEFERRRSEPLALATLVRAYGSSYRRPGARMLIAQDGTTVGVLSGGCLEEEVAARARQMIATGVPQLMSFDTRLRYGCSGAIDIFIERARPELLDEIATARRDRRECMVATTFAGPGSLGSRLVTHATDASEETFVQVLHPPLQLVVIGHGPDSAPLRSFALTLGWKVIEAEEAALLPNEFDQWTAAVVKTHNYGRDYAALARLLPMGLRYVALLGPRLRRDQLLHALHDDGVARLSELFAPAGLDLGADSPEEIALAIVSEIQTAFSGVEAESLRDRKAPIHSAAGLALA